MAVWENTASLFDLPHASFDAVIGVDEVGRGALFGPVTVGAVYLTRTLCTQLSSQDWLHKVNDSKLLNAAQRTKVAPLLANFFSHAIQHTAVSYLDRYNISRAVDRGIYKSVQKILEKVEIPLERVYVLFDGKIIPHYPQLLLQKPMPFLKCEVKADRHFFPVAAASILAKVARDTLIARAAERFPQYGLEKHAGYGTQRHRQAIIEYGLTKFHRRSFRVS
ncbi:MAG TPA: ribonuclease HII [Turneriella sp.]|nr:ribonuclease HII [Turneriella sp.]